MTDLTLLKKALDSLKDSLSPPPANERERDGTIQCFEYTFELSWKAAKRVLFSHGIEALTPKTVIRTLGEKGWIENVEDWLNFLQARNESSHTYLKQTAEAVFKAAQRFVPACESLINILETKN